jgi:tripeptide aminopeptidase
MPSIDPERLLATFLDLVRIDSPSREEAACGAYCARVLEEAGCTVHFDESASATGSDTGNLIAELPGTLPATLVLSAHLDTVEPGRGVDPVVSDGTVFAAGDTVLGADDKSGLAAAIECVRVYAAANVPVPTVRCVFTVQEEVGLLGAKALDPVAASGDLCLVLDAGGPPGGIVIGAPTHYTFTATIAGRAAHAGVSPHEGVSAIAVAADAISRIRIGWVDECTTANVGTITGGTATNVIAAQAVLTGECRSRDRDRVEAVRDEMDAALRAAAEEGGAHVEIEWHLEYEGFDVAEDSHLVRIVSDACRLVGLEPLTMVTGGGSDANVLAALGVPTLALSCGMQGVHGVNEQIEVVDLEALASLCVAVGEVLGSRAEA